MRIGRIAFGMLIAAGVAAQAPENSVRKTIVDAALSFRGVPYVYGASSPAAFDCSGFVRYVYDKAVGIAVPRTSKSLFALGRPIKPEQAKPGDILVFDTVGGAPSHVAIVLDGNSMIHAASSGPRTGVIVSKLDDKYFAPRLIGARSFIESAGRAPPTPAERPPAIPGRRRERVEEANIATIGFSITAKPELYADKIPAAVGSGVQFAITNETGADGVFEILFYLMDKDPSKAKTIRRDRVAIKAGAMAETEAILFSEPGQYRLILKTRDNIKRVERTWRVVSVR